MIALAVAVGILFALNAALLLAVLALARQVGVLHERIAPIGALTMDRGPRVGDRAPLLNLQALAGETLTIGAPGPRGQLLFFLSPDCPVCKKLLPALRSLAHAERARLDVILASDGAADEHRAFAAREKLGLPYVLSAELGLRFQVGKLPYGVLIGADGIVRAKGLVNTREQIESLLEAAAQGVGSVQEFLARESAHSV